MRLLISLTAALFLAPASHAQEPELPAGLDDEPALPGGLDDEPALPGGLDDEPALPGGLDDEPDLPMGLDAEVVSAPAAPERFEPPFTARGLVEVRGGGRIYDDPREGPATVAEGRFRLTLERTGDWLAARASGDLLYDALEDDDTPDLETGEGAVDLRELWLSAAPADWIDLKVGRQALTWGTGDLVFINDLFPKDWNALILGRDIALLKAPSDALKASVYLGPANLDLVWTPRFDADRFPDRLRVSTFDPLTGGLAGRETPMSVTRPDAWIDDGEYAGRLYATLSGVEVAAYGYHGYWKSPAGIDPLTGRYTFPALSVYGASARAPALGGIANAEVGYYDSRDDRDGDDPFVRNGELRGLLGFEREVLSETTLGLQYNVEHMLGHSDYEDTSPPGAAVADAQRHVVTARLTAMVLSQRLMMTLFALYSPNEEDGLIRPRLTYSADDNWRLEAGANVFFGAHAHTFFGQLEDNTGAYAAARYAW
jgi:hypothetical protein